MLFCLQFNVLFMFFVVLNQNTRLFKYQLAVLTKLVLIYWPFCSMTVWSYNVPKINLTAILQSFTTFHVPQSRDRY